MDIHSTRITVNGINIQCYYAGEGTDTILLLHGAGVDSAMMSWSEIIQLLSVKYRVIAPDLPGYGDSDRIDREYSLAFYTEIIKGVMKPSNAARSYLRVFPWAAALVLIWLCNIPKWSGY